LVFEWARAHGLPVAFVLAGGYTGAALARAELVDLHLLTIEAADRPN
jgi:acetoin utilization deacetylase AcuC-like enzyme